MHLQESDQQLWFRLALIFLYGKFLTTRISTLIGTPGWLIAWTHSTNDESIKAENFNGIIYSATLYTGKNRIITDLKPIWHNRQRGNELNTNRCVGKLRSRVDSFGRRSAHSHRLSAIFEYQLGGCSPWSNSSTSIIFLIVQKPTSPV